MRTVTCNGLLFIGDPHLAKRRPGRRTDDYTLDVFTKLEAAVEIAREKDLQPVILGDLFNIAHENDLSTLVKLMRLLKKFHKKALCVGGNHDKKNFTLSDNDALELFSASEVLEVIDGEAREVLHLQMGADLVSLWVAPYGAKIPERIESPDAPIVIMATHHDLAFQGAYPGAALLREIPGCTAVVNGHMHKTTPTVRMGGTLWHNPGNIEPLSIDCIDHLPAVWEWTAKAATSDMVRHLLPHNRDIWDLTGLSVPESSVKASVADIDIPAVPVSEFAQLLNAQTKLETAREDTEDSFVKELDSGFDTLKVPAYVRSMLISLARQLPPPVLEDDPSI